MACGIFPALDDFPPLPKFEPYARTGIGISFVRRQAYNDTAEAMCNERLENPDRENATGYDEM